MQAAVLVLGMHGKAASPLTLHQHQRNAGLSPPQRACLPPRVLPPRPPLPLSQCLHLCCSCEALVRRAAQAQALSPRRRQALTPQALTLQAQALLLPQLLPASSFTLGMSALGSTGPAAAGAGPADAGLPSGSAQCA